MHNGKTRMNTNERSEQTKPEAVNQQLPPSQGSAAAQPSERPAPGRRTVLHPKDLANQTKPEGNPG
jgi:hypothetical protein